MLIQEEQYIIKWLSQYRTLEQRQIHYLLRESSETFIVRTLSRLTREGYLFKNPEYVGLEPELNTDRKLLDAIWVMLRFSNEIGPMAHYPAQYPAQVFFMKGQTAYEIIVLERDEAHIIRLLQVTDEVKYIIVLPDIAMVSGLKLPNAPCIFATVQRMPDADAQVRFYTGGDIDGVDR